MRWQWNQAGKDWVEREIISFVDKAVAAAVEDTRPYIHVDTGRLQKSLRPIPGERSGSVYLTGLIAGGIRLRGVVREQDKERDVAYAMIEEVRHPQMRAYFIPALTRRVSRGN